MKFILLILIVLRTSSIECFVSGFATRRSLRFSSNSDRATKVVLAMAGGNKRRGGGSAAGSVRKRRSNANKTKKNKKSSKSAPSNKRESSGNQHLSTKKKTAAAKTNNHAPPWQIVSKKDIANNVKAEKKRREQARQGVHLTQQEAEQQKDAYSISRTFLDPSDKALLAWRPFTAPSPSQQYDIEFMGAFLDKRLPPRISP